MKIRGIVLAGGKSSRFREDKALAKIGNVTMIEHAVELLHQVNLDVAIVTNAVRDYSFLNCKIVQDVIPEKGPIGGLYTVCEAFRNETFLVLTCDMPGVSIACLQNLLKHHSLEYQVSLYGDERQAVNPFPGIYSASLKNRLKEKIAYNQLSMHELLTKTERLNQLPPFSDSKVFFNVNLKSDLEQWRINISCCTLCRRAD